MKGKNIIKKAVSLIMASSLLIGLYPSAGIVKAEDDLFAGTNLLVHYEFKDGGADSSGNGYNATIGAGVTVENGFASLPGGDKDSSAFITLPEGMFDKQDTLTISMWVRDNDPRENWLGAFFFGSKNNSNGVPTSYYYFTPSEKDHHTLKSVFTDSVNESNPGQTETGLRKSDNVAGINTDAYRGVWTHYATVLAPGSMICYIDGEEVGRVTLKNRTVSDFGTGLQSYIGKSNYPDPLYQGDFMDFRVYTDALNVAQIRHLAGTYQPEGSQYSMTIDGNNVTKDLSGNLYGLFYEDINSAADGGLYPEMVKNYSFENAYLRNDGGSDFSINGYKTIANYKLHWTASPSGNFSIGSSGALNENNPNYAVLTGNVTLENGGFAPIANPNSASMPVKPYNESDNTGIYTFSAFVKAAENYGGTLKVKLTDSSGKALTDEKEVPLTTDGTWQKVDVELTSKVTANTKGKLVLSVTGAGTSEKLSLDMVSVTPHDTYGYGDLNYAYGVGIRQDLLDLMMDLNPKFMRFPGGCIVEGFNWEGIYDWRDTIGPLEGRKSNTNRWENWGNSDHSWGYMQSFGFGYHELLSLCEDFGMEPFPIMSAGVLCQYETAGVDAKTGADLQEFITMATDLLDYCWGDASENEWAQKRAENGHPEPFNLKYLGIGNENVQAKYLDNFEVIKEAVEAYVEENYPEHELNIISSAGPNSGSQVNDDNDRKYALPYAYDRLAQTMPGETIVDEHYYESESFMYNESDRYDYYMRTNQGGSNVFVGEYAVKNDNKYNTALAEACYITGLERNADVVTNISYAPLLYKVGNQNWSHDMIYFDEFDTAKSTNYYVQKMFGNNYGTKLIGTELESEAADYSNYGSPILGMDSAAGSIDKITVYDEAGTVLFEDDFDDNSNGWQKFSSAASGNSFSISNGKLNFSGTSGNNAVYLPEAVTNKWKNFRIEVEGAVKTSGSGGFVIGAGHEKQYYWYNMGKGGKGTVMEVTRPQRNQTSLTTKKLGNNFANEYYNTNALTTIKSNDAMNITFNFGVNHKLEASYTSEQVSAEDTAKYDFSSELNQYQTDIYQVVNMDDENVYVKLVNPDKYGKTINLKFENLNVSGQDAAEITMLEGRLNDANAIGTEVVAPVTSTQSIQNNELTYQLPAFSVNVIRVKKSQKTETKADKTLLVSAIQTASSKKQADYTAASWQALATALSDANRINQNDSATQAEVNSAVSNLNAAINGLVPASSQQQTQDVKPGTPASVKAAWSGKKDIKITWKSAANAKEYEVYRSNAENSGFKKIATVGTASYTDKKVSAGKTSYYKIIAVNGTQRSDYSKAAAIAGPKGIKAKVKNKTVTVSFKKIKKVSGYEIYKSTKKNGKYKKAAALKSYKTVKKSFTLKKGTYFFKVRAYKQSGGKKYYTDYSKAVTAKIK